MEMEKKREGEVRMLLLTISQLLVSYLNGVLVDQW